MVSATLQYMQNTWPSIQDYPLKIQQDSLQKFMDAYKAAQDFDKAAKQPNCEDLNKTDILKKILNRLDEIEKKLEIK